MHILKSDSEKEQVEQMISEEQAEQALQEEKAGQSAAEQGTADLSERNEGSQEKMPDRRIKKYMYIIFDKDGEVLLNKEGDPYFRSIEEGKTLDWPRNGRVIEEFREEIVEPDKWAGNKKDRKKIIEERKQDAREKLEERAADQIEKARNKRNAGGKGKIADEAVDKGLSGSSAEENPGSETADALNLSGLIQTINNAENKLNENINDMADDINDMAENIKDTLKKAGNENTGRIMEHVNDKTRLMEESIKEHVEKNANRMDHSFRKTAEDVIERVQELGEGQDKIISRAASIEKRMKDLDESVEDIVSNTQRLSQLDAIAELLQNKGLNVSMDIPPVNAEEEDIVNLVRYSHKITEQLGYAARDLVRKQEAFKSQARSNENEQRMIDRKLEAARREGIKEGQQNAVKRLISKYEDVDFIRESDNDHVHVIWTCLVELGVEIDGGTQFEKGREITISEEEARKMMAVYSKIDGGGKYKVTRTGLVYAGEIIYKAEFEKIRDPQEDTEAASGGETLPESN